VNVSTNIPTTVQIRLGRLIGLIASAVAVAVAITWLLLAFTLDSAAVPAQQSSPRSDAVTPTAVTGFEPGQWPGPPPYPPGFRGMP
jgi:hypothetical protein